MQITINVETIADVDFFKSGFNDLLVSINKTTEDIKIDGGQADLELCERLERMKVIINNAINQLNKLM